MKLAVGSAIALLVSLSLAPAHAASGTIPVAAAGFSFLAPVVVVESGSSVEWLSLALPHTVTTDNGVQQGLANTANDPTNSDGNPDTFARDLPQGASYTHTFYTPGVYHYHCELHARFGMIGVVIVQDPYALP